MTIGTRSVLYGAHCAVLHPWFLAVAWSKLYGFPWDVRLWASFCLHDIGYISKPNMDGCEGETHVELGAKIMGLLFGESWAAFYKLCGIRPEFKRFFRQRGMGVRGMGLPVPLPRSAM